MRAALAGLCAAFLVTGCATATGPMTLTIPVSPVLREACPRPDFQAVQTVGELAAFSVRQEAAVAVCNERRAAAVAVIDAANAMGAQMAQQLKPRKWWKLW
jgi:hypothetical protein